MKHLIRTTNKVRAFTQCLRVIPHSQVVFHPLESTCQDCLTAYARQSDVSIKPSRMVDNKTGLVLLEHSSIIWAILFAQKMGWKWSYG